MNKIFIKNKVKSQVKSPAGFTLIEVMISLSLFVVLILLINSMFTISQSAYNKNSNLAELTQNARVALDRLSRELRQSETIVSSLPPTDTDPGNPPINQIFFQDGHNTSLTTYILYRLEGTNLNRVQKAYYFNNEPETYVTYNSVDQAGNSPLELIISDQTVGEYFNGLEFWGASGLVNIYIKLAKNKNLFELDTMVYSRNH
ncbi:MAG: prepilin-type N-terminal cleavage/methylation domain-containing protein [bacterium]|nr:prepilin-type N-terminal cleavage/methylation domain-containing protein [bacterium]